MGLITRIRRRRADDDKGAALVEAALVLPIMILILFGLFELGFLFDSGAVASSSSRSAARLASATYGFADDAPARAIAVNNIRLTVEDELGQLNSTATPKELWIYKSQANGQPQGTSNFENCGSNCMKLTWTGSGFGATSGTWSAPDSCGDTRDQVGVYLKLGHKSISGVFGSSWTVGEYTVMRLEPRGGC